MAPEKILKKPRETDVRDIDPSALADHGPGKRPDYAKGQASLPETPVLTWIEAFQTEVNERVVRNEI